MRLAPVPTRGNFKGYIKALLDTAECRTQEVQNSWNFKDSPSYLHGVQTIHATHRLRGTAFEDGVQTSLSSQDSRVSE